MTRPDILPALPADAAALALLLTLDPNATACHLRPPPPCGEGGGGGHSAPHSPEITLTHLRRRIALGGVRIAKANGRPAGFIDRPGDEILSLYIAPHARRRGLARALVSEAQEATARLTHLGHAPETFGFWSAMGFARAPGQADAAAPRLIWNGAA